MRLHRFYTGQTIELKHDFWLRDKRLVHQWRNVLRFQPGQEVVLFDGQTHDRLYKVEQINSDEVHLIFVTDLVRKLPSKNVYLLWSLLKKDKNEWVLQKCTELGISHFVPLLADRSEKTGFSLERAQKIVTEAAEQCGRSDIPSIREPIHIGTAIEIFNGKIPLLVCEQVGQDTWTNLENVGVLIGPEGGWSDQEKVMFDEYHLAKFSLHDFTLRAETACVAAVNRILTK